MRQTSISTIKRTEIVSVLSVIALFCWLACRGYGDSHEDLVTAARSQIGVTVRYDSSYRSMEYPNGDIPMEIGVCTDVVIRAVRSARQMDLQRLVHEDMKANFSEYPKRWRLENPDKNIDHRRVPNLKTFFERSGWSLPVTRDTADYAPGDFVTCTVPPNLPHIMIVSDKKNGNGIPLIIHNIGAGVQEEDRLFEFELTGHYRVPASGTYPEN